MYVFKASKDNRVSYKLTAGEQNSPISNMATIFAKNVCDAILNNMKLMLINAETKAALNLQEETVFFTPRFSPWLQCICSKMTSIKYLGALATRVI